MDSGELPKDNKATSIERQFEDMLDHPTIALVRLLSVAPILSTPWTFTFNGVAPDGMTAFVTDRVMTLRSQFVTDSAYGTWDYGWQPFAKEWETDSSGKKYVSKLKALLQEKTTISVEADGSFAGLKNFNTPVDVEDSLVTNINVRGTNWYGRGILRKMKKPFDRWNATMSSAERYERKISGAVWWIKYPSGSTMLNGSLTPNSQVAATLGQTIVANGFITTEDNSSTTALDGISSNGKWDIQLLSSYPTYQVAFGDTLRSHEVQMARAGELPERAVFEAEHGSRADSGNHIEFASTGASKRLDSMVEQFVKYVLRKVVAANWGEEVASRCGISLGSISTADKNRIAALYTSLINDPATRASEVLNNVDTKSLAEMVGLPVKKDPDHV
jgi:hypothetical protein